MDEIVIKDYWWGKQESMLETGTGIFRKKTNKR